MTGYALRPPTVPSLFEICKIDDLVDPNIGDVRGGESLKAVMRKAEV